jgi:hypothetical protein
VNPHVWPTDPLASASDSALLHHGQEREAAVRCEGDIMKAYLIDPFAKTVTEYEYNGDYKSIYVFIDASTFDVARLDKGDGIYIDDNGLISGKHQEFFLVQGYPTPLAGKGLLLGCDNEGNSTSPHLTFDEFTSMVTFISNLEVQIGARAGRWG